MNTEHSQRIFIRIQFFYDKSQIIAGHQMDAEENGTNVK